MANTLRFNLARYNLGQQTTQPVRLKHIATGDIKAAIGESRLINVRHSATGTFGGRMSMVVLVPTEHLPRAEVSSASELRMAVTANHFSEGEVSAQIYIGKIINVPILYFARALLSAAVGKNIPVSHIAESETNITATVGKQIKTTHETEGIVGAHISVSAMELLTAAIDVTIPPGGSVTINSDIFTALMGNNNIIHLYSGEWIHLDRGVEAIEITTGSGKAIEGNMVYTARYL